MEFDDNLNKIENAVNKKVDIPKRWKKHILEEFKKQAIQVNAIWEIEDIINGWDWITKDCKWVWRVVNLLDRYPASTVYLLTINYIFDNNLDSKDFDKKYERRIRDQIRNAVYKIHSAGLITGIVMNPEECAPGIRAPTIWVSPFVKDHEIERTKSFYKNMGGGAKGTKEKKISKDPKDITEHNLKVRAHSILAKWKENYKTYNYYKCPKLHEDGYIRKKKTKSKALHRIRNPTCNECSKDLELISFLEFYEHKETKLFLNWGLKK